MSRFKVRTYPDLYICDPEKNTLCKKTNCGDLCLCTANLDYAKRPLHKVTDKEYEKIWKKLKES